MSFESSVRNVLSTSGRKGKKTCHLLIVYCRTFALIIFYYCCSIGLTFYQKQLLKDYGFPLTVVVTHLYVKFLLAGVCRFIYNIITNQQRIILSWDTYWRRLFPPGAAGGLDIGLSQWSLEYITVTLYTMSKSTALLFILFFGIILKLEEMRWSVVILMIFIAGGLMMFTYKYTQFNLFGFLLVMTASFLSGLRWTWSQMVMQRGELGLSNPIDMIYHIQPWMIISLLPLTVYIEGLSLATSEDGFCFHNISKASWMWLRILLGAFVAFFMEISEYLMVSFTSSLTFSIAGVAKEILTLTLAIHYYHENLSLINKIGLALCIIGIMLHVVLKTSHDISSSTRSPRPSSSEDCSTTAPLLGLTNIDAETEEELYSR